MRGIRYVSGAPESVIADFEEYMAILNALSPTSERFEIVSSRVAILELLLTDPKMNYVWRTLERKESSRNDQFEAKSEGFRRYWTEVWFAAGPALLARVNHPSDIVIRSKDYLPAISKLTPAERREKENELYSQFLRIATEAKKYNIGLNLLKYFSDEHLRGMQLTLAGKALEVDSAEIESSLLALPELPEHRLSIAFKSSPSLYELLISISEEIASGIIFDVQGLETPGREKAALNKFMKSIGYHFLDRYQKPMYQVIADTAATIFGIEALSKDQVPRISA